MQTLLSDGRMKDLSGHVHHGTITGTTDIAGKVGRARHFNAGDRITASPISVSATDFTVAAWFRWTTNPSPYYSGIQGGGGSWELRVMADGRFGATFYQSIGPDVFTEILSPLAYNDGTWHHVAAVLRSGLVGLYVDGILVAQDTTNPITSVRTSTQTVVGRVASDFAGDIDEVFVYGRALSDAEIGALASGTTLVPLSAIASAPLWTSGTSTGLGLQTSCELEHGSLPSHDSGRLPINSVSPRTTDGTLAGAKPESEGSVPQTTFIYLAVGETRVLPTRKGADRA